MDAVKMEKASFAALVEIEARPGYELRRQANGVLYACEPELIDPVTDEDHLWERIETSDVAHSLAVEGTRHPDRLWRLAGVVPAGRGCNELVERISTALIQACPNSDEDNETCLDDEEACFNANIAHYAWYQDGRWGITGESRTVVRFVLEQAGLLPPSGQEARP